MTRFREEHYATRAHKIWAKTAQAPKVFSEETERQAVRAEYFAKSRKRFGSGGQGKGQRKLIW